MEINVLVGLAVVAVGVLAFVVWLPIARHRLHREQRVEGPGPETMDLRPEPPAVVNLLVNELDLTRDAVAATILDLAVRDHVDIVQLSPTDNLVVPTRNPRDPLLPYEDRLLHVMEQAAAGGPHATIGAIAEALRPGTADTWLRFADEVTRDARQRGLTASTATSRETTAMMLLALVPSVGVLIAAPMAYIVTPFLFVGLFLGAVLLLVIGRTTRLTPAGRDAATHWLGVRRFIGSHGTFDELPPGAVALWDRYLAYGAAMGLSGLAAEGLVTELRTTLSLSDLGGAFVAIRTAVRAQRDPAAHREWRGEQLRALFGPDTDPDAVYGPERGDFWELLATTGRSWPFALWCRKADPEAWQRAALARIDSLVASAPAELAADAATVAGAARQAVSLLAGTGDVSDSTLRDDPVISSPAVQAASSRMAAGIARHLGVEETPAAVVEALVGGPAGLGPVGD